MSDIPDDEWITFSEAAKHAEENLEGWSADLIRDWLIAEIESGRVRARGGWFVPAQTRPPSNVFERRRWRDEGRPFRQEVIGGRKLAYPERALVHLRSFTQALERVVERERAIADRVERKRGWRDTGQRIGTGEEPTSTEVIRVPSNGTKSGVIAPGKDVLKRMKRHDVVIRERAVEIAIEILSKSDDPVRKIVADEIVQRVYDEFRETRSSVWAYGVIKDAMNRLQ